MEHEAMKPDEEEVLWQEIAFERGQPLGLGVDEELTIRRINNPDSAAIRGARYGVVHWTIASVDGTPVTSKAELSEALGREGEGRVVLGLRAISERQDERRVVSAVHGTPQDLEDLMRTGAVVVKEGSSERRRRRDDTLEEEEEEDEDEEPFSMGKKKSEEARRALAVSAALPTFSMGGGRRTRLITGSCTWQLTEGDKGRSDVAVKGCAAYTILGCSTFDCGDIYAGVEELVGKFVATARAHAPELADKIKLHTKVIPDFVESDASLSAGALHEALRKRITAGVLRSANRLGVATLDLVNLHWWDWNVPGYDFAIDLLCNHLSIARHVGLTNVDLDHLERVLRDHHGKTLDDDRAADTLKKRRRVPPPIACVQVNLSLVDRRPLTSGLAELCVSENVPLLAHGTLCGGLLSEDWLGKPRPSLASLRPGRALNLIFIDEFGGWDAFQSLLERLAHIAKKSCDDERVVTIPMVAVAWALAQRGVSAVVLGARDAKHVEDAAFATGHLQLDAADVEAINVFVKERGPAGPVYDLERNDPRCVVLSGSGADGDVAKPVDRAASRAGSRQHLDECARRLLSLRRCYAKAMPAVPADLRRFFQEEEDISHTNGGEAWMASCAYENLDTTQRVQLLRNFVAELDSMDDTADPHPSLRAFAARMLASTEQARFLQQKNDPNAPRLLSFKKTTDAAAAAARMAFRDKLIAAAKKGMAAQQQQVGDSAPVPGPAEACCLQ